MVPQGSAATSLRYSGYTMLIL